MAKALQQNFAELNALQSALQAHGWVATIGLGFFLPLGILVAKLGQGMSPTAWRIFFFIHVSVQVGAGSVGSAAVWSLASGLALLVQQEHVMHVCRAHLHLQLHCTRRRASQCSSMGHSLPASSCTCCVT